MANKLKKLMINRADLVDKPSNPRARVMLYKRQLEVDTLSAEDFELEYMDLLGTFFDSIHKSTDTTIIKTAMLELSDKLDSLLDKAPVEKVANNEILIKYEKTVDVLAELDKLILGGEISANEVSELLEGLEMADKTDKELIETLKAQLAEKETEIAKAKKDAKDAEDAADAKKKKDDADAADMKKREDDAKEGIWKGVAPELKAKFEQLEKSAADSEKIAKAAEENAATVKLEKRVSEDLKAIDGGTSVEKTALLREIEKMLPADKFEKLYTILKSASVAIEKGELLNERGTGVNGKSGNTAFEKIKAQAKQMVSDKIAKTEAEAIAKVAKTNPTLYKEYLEEQS